MMTDVSDTDVLVTGGLGFVGSHLAEELVSRGASVTIFDINESNSGANYKNIEDFDDKLEYIKGDVRNEEDVQKVVAEKDFIFHLAAQVSRVKANKEPQIDTEINCKGSLNILKAAQEAPNEPRIVFTSSRAVYGSPKELPVSEDSQTRPRDIYGANKLAVENYIDIYNHNGLTATTARLANVYGPRAQVHNTNYGVINVFVRKAVENDDLTVFRPGSIKRDWVYVEDTVDALIQMATSHEATGEIYNIGTGTSYSILETANIIVEIADRGSVTLVDWPEDWEEMKVGDFVPDTTKIQRDIGWEHNTDLRTGLEETISFYEENLEYYK